ncbi:MAG: calcium/sodium antiporter [Bacillota bacterium]|nr:calcium/sodium antiporter [Bacillota bacterium]
MAIIIELVVLTIGFVLLIKGADWFVDGASGIAAKLGIPQLVIGLTIVAMGTSAPEAAVSISAAFKGSADITIGNIVGSNIMNILIILGLSAVITPLRVAKSTVRYEIPFMILMTVLLMVLGLSGEITALNGLILWGFFILYFVYLIVLTKKQNTTGKHICRGDAANAVKETFAEISAEKKRVSIPKAVILVLIGMALIVLGSNLAVDAASDLARMFGFSERIIGLTIVALGTSLPELVTSVMAARKGNADIAIGNIVGSNLFNILFVIGTSSLIIPIPFASAFVVDFAVATVAAVILWIFCLRENRLSRICGGVMLATYVIYFTVWLI